MIDEFGELTEEQKNVLDRILLGQNVFFTGSAGTGKTFLLKRVIDALYSKYPREEVAVVASTGIAAVQIGGTTLHSFFGVGIPRKKRDFLRMKRKRTKICSTRVLIIDEVSMVSGSFFDSVEKVCKNIRERTMFNGMDSGMAFGGLQIIATGDFFQLPPVFTKKHKLPERYLDDNEDFEDAGFCFEADCWEKTFGQHLELTKVFRQEDELFSGLLNESRVGALKPNSVRILRQHTNKLDTSDGIYPTKLFSTNNKVNEINEEKLRSIKEAVFQYHANDYKIVDYYEDRVVDQGPVFVPKSSNLKEAQETFYKNDPSKLPSTTESINIEEVLRDVQNNLRGDIELQNSLASENRDWILENIKKEVLRFRKRLNTELKAEITSLGKTEYNTRLKLLENDPSWNNCTTLETLRLKVGAQVLLTLNIDMNKDPKLMLVNGSRGVVVGHEKPLNLLLSLHTEINLLRNELKGDPNRHRREFLERKILETKFKMLILSDPVYPDLPIVRFSNGRTVTISPECFFKNVGVAGRCSRFQIPLRLAWAITIHKCQGMTLEKVTISLNNIFASGQAYVALSRAKSLLGLEIDSFDPSVFKVEEKVLLWMREKFPDNPYYMTENHIRRTLPVDRFQSNQIPHHDNSYSQSPPSEDSDESHSPYGNFSTNPKKTKRVFEINFSNKKKQRLNDSSIKTKKEIISIESYNKKIEPKGESISIRDYYQKKKKIDNGVIDLTDDEESNSPVMSNNTHNPHMKTEKIQLITEISDVELDFFEHFQSLKYAEQRDLMIRLEEISSGRSN